MSHVGCPKPHGRALGHIPQASPHVLDDPGVSIVFTDLGPNSLELDVRCWSQSHDHNAMVDDVRTRVYDALAAADIEIPCQQVVIAQATADA